MERTTHSRDGAQSVQIKTGGVTLEGELAVPPGAQGLVLFAHGSGSSRFSPRNQSVAQWLREAGLATFLMDLLTGQEEAVDQYTRHLRFNISLLAGRVVSAVDWLRQNKETQDMAPGIFGASTGAAAALVAAAERPEAIGAVVSRGGRPDLADTFLDRVRAPTLLIVGGADDIVIGLNREAFAKLGSEKQMEIIPGATHLFEEPGTLEQVGHLTADWFTRHLVREQVRQS